MKFNDILSCREPLLSELVVLTNAVVLSFGAFLESGLSFYVISAHARRDRSRNQYIRTSLNHPFSQGTCKDVFFVCDNFIYCSCWTDSYILESRLLDLGEPCHRVIKSGVTRRYLNLI